MTKKASPTTRPYSSRSDELKAQSARCFSPKQPPLEASCENRTSYKKAKSKVGADSSEMSESGGFRSEACMEIEEQAVYIEEALFSQWASHAVGQPARRVVGAQKLKIDKYSKKIPRPGFLARALPSKISCFERKFRGNRFEEPAALDPFSMRLQKTGNMIVKRKGLRVKRLHRKVEEIKEIPNQINA